MPSHVQGQSNKRRLPSCHAFFNALGQLQRERRRKRVGKRKRKRKKVAAALRVTFEFLRKFSHTQLSICCYCCCCCHCHCCCCCCWWAENDVTCINNWVLQQQENKQRQRQAEMKYGEWQNAARQPPYWVEPSRVEAHKIFIRCHMEAKCRNKANHKTQQVKAKEKKGKGEKINQQISFASICSQVKGGKGKKWLKMATSVIYDLQLIRQMENTGKWLWPSKQFRQMKGKQSTTKRSSSSF